MTTPTDIADHRDVADVVRDGEPVVVDGDPTEASRRRVQLVDVAQWRELAAAQPTGWLVERVIPRSGITMVAGSPRAGKSTLALGVGVHVAAGRAVLGREVDAGRIAIAYEDRTDVAHPLEIIDAVATGIGCTADELPIRLVRIGPDRAGWSLDDDDHVAELRVALDAEDVRLVVVDSLRRVTRADEDDAGEMSAAMARLSALTSSGQRAAIAIHHAGHGQSRPRGSSDIMAAIESQIVASRDGETVSLELEHHRAGDETIRARITRSDDAIYLAQCDGRDDGGEVDEAICRMLTQRSPVPGRDIERHVRGGATSIRAAIRRLVTTGRIRRTSRGYELVDSTYTDDEVTV